MTLDQTIQQYSSDPVYRSSVEQCPKREIVIFSPKESATLEALRLHRDPSLSLRQIANIATRLFGRPIAKSTVQHHLAIRAKRQERAT